MARPRERWLDVGLLVLRLGFGLGLFYFHGLGKLTGGPEAWARTGGAVSHVGIGFGHTIFGFMAAVAEGIGGLCIAAGFLFRPAALLIAATMLVATLQHIITGRGTPAHAFKNFWVAVGLVMMGPGRYSVDHWWRSRRQAPQIEIVREEAT